MGYTHYWYREREIDRETFKKIISDFNKVTPELNSTGFKLAGWDGTGEPVINEDRIEFNGVVNCGHEHTGEIGIAWPADKPKFGASSDGSAVVAGSWFAGALLSQRSCDGDCSHETFNLPRVFKSDFEQTHSKKKKLLFDCCKTAFKPYDLAVNIILIIARHHLKNKIIVSSDGDMDQWEDGIKACQTLLGYGNKFKLED